MNVLTQPLSREQRRLRVLQPEERISEVLFGLIMVLTFTGSISIAEAGREDIRTMLIAALGCNIAWGIIDAVLYLMGCLADRGRAVMTLRAVQQSTEQHSQEVVQKALPPMIASILEPAELQAITRRLQQLPEPPKRAALRGEDWVGALGIFLIVFITTFPVAIPFLFMNKTHAAMRVSNLIAVLMLFAAGYAFGRITGGRPWLFGSIMVVVGAVLVSMTIALGG